MAETSGPIDCSAGLKELSVGLYNHLLQPNTSSEDLHDVQFFCCDIDSDLISRAKTGNPFPESITFSSLDIMDPSSLDVLQHFLEKFGEARFDIGFCMSITMWIHLNHGDHGLVEFLKKLTTLCEYLLVEPQPWKCYRSAARRLRKLGRQDFDHFHTLAIRGDMTEQISNILTRDCSSELVHRFGNTSWDRSLLLFKNRSTKLPS
ncbi:RNA 5'-monophosphate methyltransferase isoform X2 [Pyxicephalus adspersus]|uniref:RNA 5'-monophosphate methyltransferase isoform X2 n=1 Tax=Pyxicephalus adspersus TaxID=30357 RepID=UPI003B5C89DB